ncbi:MAG: UDP-N-acetylglucosamine 1-carboxyvinyltransferase, partial [Deltaproteobacteria bacterium]|jgi:UDP-N-acetylglucosamine 1-carboxyvinyltransferase|nr:UDP-N-acetylglucosamine 1-carboxyvinyltransferase [Deltaproteobacteria bacterium]MBW2536992.1 UDP-N-acetylglucosamine 1-carboxyvinyltransferase [Deltaproteobacteria bacterium]
LGARAEWVGDHEVAIDASGVDRFEAPYDLVRKMRASFLVLGPLLARFGSARVSEPGGCAIGVRPVDQHLKGFEALGGKLRLDHGYVEATAQRLRGASIAFDLNTVNGTQNVMMAACLAEGETVLENAAREPEVVELAEMLLRMGADVAGAGSDRIVIRGVKALRGVRHQVSGDRIEAGTLLAAGLATRGDVAVEGVDPAYLESTLEKLRAGGGEIETHPSGVRLVAEGPIQALRVVTAPFPGFPTDMQAQLMAVLTLARGSSVVTERVFENRFMHVPELQRMGADIALSGRSAHVTGVEKLMGAPVMATDLRASAGLIVAGLAAEGDTVVSRVYHIDRGYERIEEKLRGLGADIRREG